MGLAIEVVNEEEKSVFAKEATEVPKLETEHSAIDEDSPSKDLTEENEDLIRGVEEHA